MATPKQQRLVLAGIAAIALIGAGVLAVVTLDDTATYFQAPSDIVASAPAAGQVFRLGGLVKPGSIHRDVDGLTLYFTVTDTNAETSVSYRGIVPDLFKENQGVIATGSIDPSGRFVATELLARHDENYMPPEVAKAVQRQLEATQPAHPGA
ncbi:MAG: cytochrome c maturation protein CcmE [Sphingomonadaceae bacterium]